MRNFSFYRLYASLRHPRLRPLFEIPTHLTDKEKITLFQLSSAKAQSLPNNMLAVEIGSYVGASTSFLAAGIGEMNGLVFCIDTWTNDTMTEGGRDTMAEFKRNTTAFLDRLVPIRGRSTEPDVIAQVSSRTEKVDLLFIDGDHSYEGVLADWKAYCDLLAPDAIVIMHDIGWAEGVQRVVNEEIRPLTSNEYRLPNLWWGQIRR
jgi:predicted O-methyltransferase YrrM